MLHKKLVDLRKSKGLTQEQMAKLIAMEQTTYSRKETGKSPVTQNEWERFAKALETNIEEIKDDNSNSIKNENCTFHDSNIGVNYVSIPQSLLDVVMKYNQKLEEENQVLKTEIAIIRKPSAI